MFRKGIFYVTSEGKDKSIDIIRLRFVYTHVITTIFGHRGIFLLLREMSLDGVALITPFECAETRAHEYRFSLTALPFLIEKFENDERFDITRLYQYNLSSRVYYGGDISI